MFYDRLVIVFYVVTIASFCFPQVVDVNVFSSSAVLDAFSFCVICVLVVCQFMIKGQS